MVAVVQLETTLNDERAAAATAVGGQGSRRAGTGLGVGTRSLGRPISFNGLDGNWGNWSVVFRWLVNTSLTALLAHAEAADPVALANSLQENGTTPAASVDLYHFLLHLTTGPAIDKEVTIGDGECLKARHPLVARWDPMLGSRSAGIMLELVPRDFADDLLSKMEDE